MGSNIDEQMHAAVTLYESFREKTPKRIRTVDFDIPLAVAAIGYVDAIDYETTHGRKRVLYRHEFAKGSRPLMAVSADGAQLLLLGGRYVFTDRGIVDLDHRGRERPDPKHGKMIDESG